MGDAVGIAHVYRPRRGSRNPYWPGRVTKCYPKGHRSGYHYKITYDDFDDDKHASVWVAQLCSLVVRSISEPKHMQKTNTAAARHSQRVSVSGTC